MSETRKTVLCMKTHIKIEGTVMPWSQASGYKQEWESHRIELAYVDFCKPKTID